MKEAISRAKARVNSLEREVGVYDNPNMTTLVRPGGEFEQVEVLLTDLLLKATRGGSSGDAEAVRALGERLVKAKCSVLP